MKKNTFFYCFFIFFQDINSLNALINYDIFEEAQNEGNIFWTKDDLSSILEPKFILQNKKSISQFSIYQEESFVLHIKLPENQKSHEVQISFDLEKWHEDSSVEKGEPDFVLQALDQTTQTPIEITHKKQKKEHIPLCCGDDYRLKFLQQTEQNHIIIIFSPLLKHEILFSKFKIRSRELLDDHRNKKKRKKRKKRLIPKTEIHSNITGTILGKPATHNPTKPPLAPPPPPPMPKDKPLREHEALIKIPGSKKAKTDRIAEAMTKSCEFRTQREKLKSPEKRASRPPKNEDGINSLLSAIEVTMGKRRTDIAPDEEGTGSWSTNPSITQTYTCSFFPLTEDKTKGDDTDNDEDDEIFEREGRLSAPLTQMNHSADLDSTMTSEQNDIMEDFELIPNVKDEPKPKPSKPMKPLDETESTQAEAQVQQSSGFLRRIGSFLFGASQNPSFPKKAKTPKKERATQSELKAEKATPTHTTISRDRSTSVSDLKKLFEGAESQKEQSTTAVTQFRKKSVLERWSSIAILHDPTRPTPTGTTQERSGSVSNLKQLFETRTSETEALIRTKHRSATITHDMSLPLAEKAKSCVKQTTLPKGPHRKENLFPRTAFKRNDSQKIDKKTKEKTE